VLSHLFNKALEWEWIDKKPARCVKYRINNIRTTYLYLLPEEIAIMLQKAREDKCPIVEPFIRIAPGTAMRRTDMAVSKSTSLIR
jgi:hypothetical protein